MAGARSSWAAAILLLTWLRADRRCGREPTRRVSAGLLVLVLVLVVTNRARELTAGNCDCTVFAGALLACNTPAPQ